MVYIKRFAYIVCLGVSLGIFAVFAQEDSSPQANDAQIALGYQADSAVDNFDVQTAYDTMKDLQ
ncbi:MAG: hypothetical protein WCJ39_02785 [bacterium]